jgi:hypothetical protein
MATRYGYFLSPEEHPPPDLVRHFGELTKLITEDMISTPCDPDPAVHLRGIQAYRDPGFDEVYISQAGPDDEGFFEFYASRVLPRRRGVSTHGPRGDVSAGRLSAGIKGGRSCWPGGDPDGIRHVPGFQR